MNKTQLKTVKDSKEKVESIKVELSELVDHVVLKIDEEIETIGNLQGELQEQYDDLGEKAQEGDKGTALQEDIDALGEIKDELDSIKDSLSEDAFEEIADKYDSVPNMK
jgi:hypothetical protein